MYNLTIRRVSLVIAASSKVFDIDLDEEEAEDLAARLQSSLTEIKKSQKN